MSINPEAQGLIERMSNGERIPAQEINGHVDVIGQELLKNGGEGLYLYGNAQDGFWYRSGPEPDNAWRNESVLNKPLSPESSVTEKPVENYLEEANAEEQEMLAKMESARKLEQDEFYWDENIAEFREQYEQEHGRTPTNEEISDGMREEVYDWFEEEGLENGEYLEEGISERQIEDLKEMSPDERQNYIDEFRKKHEEQYQTDSDFEKSVREPVQNEKDLIDNNLDGRRADLYEKWSNGEMDDHTLENHLDRLNEERQYYRSANPEYGELEDRLDELDRNREIVKDTEEKIREMDTDLGPDGADLESIPAESWDPPMGSP